MRQNLDTRGHAPEKFDRITGRQGNDIRHSALIIKDKLARIAVRSQCARRLGRQPRLSRRPLASEVSQYLRPIVGLITIPADVEKS